MAGRFPGARDVGELWANLSAGVESIRIFRDEELLAAGVDARLLAHPDYVRAGAPLAGCELFDARFFGYSPREAELLDPQQRLFLETCAAALEDAGCDPQRFDGPIGVYGGASLSTYLLHLASRPELVAAVGAWQAGLGNAPDFVATRVAYKLGLEGPAYTVQTACSTSLVAVHLACQGLLGYETDLAIAGGASVRVPQVAGYLYEESGISSPDGHTRPFDARARGTVFGSGVGAVVLRRLEDAVERGDRILAVIRGSATNNDGAHKVAFTAPSLKKQREVIAEALANADVEPETIGLVEAHGTGTELGDPIEVAALSEAFATPKRGFCALGSIKSNLGHLDAAAGVAGLIKAVLALHHRELPPSLNFERPNPKIDFGASPFFVNTALRPWPAGPGPRRAAVSSFGFGGTNAHVVLEEAPQPWPSGPSRSRQLLLLSAKTETALAAARTRLAERLEREPGLPLADVAFTLAQGRTAHGLRQHVVAADAAEAVMKLAALSTAVAPTERQDPPIAFLFPGQGSQFPGMAGEIYREEPVFRGVVDDACARLRPLLGRDLLELLFPRAGEEDAAAAALRETRFAQPALFVVELALARLWQSFGIAPAALLGHSIGEWVAAHLAGVFELADALALVAERGRLMGAVPPGGMVALDLSEAAAAPFLGDGVELAVVNGPESVVLAGPEAAIAGLLERLAAAGVDGRRLHTSHAFHTAMMEPAAAAFEAKVAAVARRAPTKPFLSNLTGTWIRPEQATDPAYWAAQLRRPVRFGDGLGQLLADPAMVLLEVGPGQTLGKLARRHAAGGRDRVVAASVSGARPRQPDLEVLLHGLGALWQAGVEVDWPAFGAHERRRKVALPTYAFEGRRCWIDGGPLGLLGGAAPGVETLVDAGEPAPDEVHPATSGGAFETSEERQIAWIFGELLGVEKVGRHDDFFALGGDSLLATRVLSRLRDQLGVKIPLERVYAAPTVAGLAAEVVAAAEPGARGADEDTGPRRLAVRPARLPLSFAQQRLWFLHQLEAGAGAYNLPGALRLAGSLRVAMLARSLAALTARHESLRTVFELGPDGAAQRVLPRLVPALPVVDLRALPAAGRERLGRRLLEAELARPFDLARGPLLRVLVVRLEEALHLCLVTLHHTVADGWSWAVLARELGEVYGAFAAGREPALPELPLQYPDFALWQRQWAAGGGLAAELDFWRERLEPLPVPLALPADRPRPAAQSFRGGNRRHHFGAGSLAELEALARRAGASLFATLLAAFDLLLARLSGQRGYAIGTPIANRRFTQLESAIGVFVNTLVLRSRVRDGQSFGELLAAVRDESLAAFEHQDLPFERLVDELAPQRDLALPPLVQVLFVLQNAPLAAVALPELELSPLELDPGTAMLDLTLGITPGPARLEGQLEWSSDLFDPTTMERLLRAYETLLAAVVASPAAPVAGLPLLPAVERHQLLVEWNATERVFPQASPAATLDAAIAAQVRRTPAALAVASEVEELSYGELLARADALAATLQGLGVGPEVRVGVCLERSAELVVALLAVLRAGGAYVPLDPDYPERRLAFMVEDAGLGALVCRAPLLGRLPAAALTAVAVVDLDELELAAMAPAALRELAAEGDRLAYVIFTSGSTGRPKGAMNRHGAVLNRLLWMQERYGLGAGDRVLQKTPFSFDVSVWEFFWPLMVGATLVVARPGGHREPAYLAELIAKRAVTTLHFVPSMLQAFLAEPTAAACRSLVRVVLSGEALPFELEQRFFSVLPGVRLENLYGPTEAAVDVTYAPCGPAARRRPVPIGRPVANTTIHLLGRDFRPVPPGAAGELAIGGVQVGRGYLGRPGLTAERFVPDPLAAAPGARLYRTGDLARHLAGGAVEYLGRLDHQVKVRGFRIELGEIEAALREHPAVHEVVVVARAAGAGNTVLVAYWVRRETAGVGEETAEEVLARHLGERLPEHMVPALFLRLPALPLSPSGKVDRLALPDPVWPAAGGQGSEAPKTATEVLLAGIWQEVLGLERVGRHDNFFRLGGESIVSLQIMARANQAGLALGPRSIFEHQTVAALAAAADAASGQPMVLAEQGPVSGPAALTAIQHWFCAAPPAEPWHWNQALMVASAAPLATGPLEGALRALLVQHDALRARFELLPGGGARQEIAPPGAPVPLARLDLGALAPATRARCREALAAGAQASLDLGRGPLLRCLLLDGDEGRADRLLLVIHHLVVDGISWRILLEDLSTAYLALAAGQAVHLPAKTTSLPAWAERLARHSAEDAGLAAEVAYWRSLPAGDPLPSDFGGGAGREGEAATVEAELSPAASRALLVDVPTLLHASLNEVLLAGLAITLGRWSGGRSFRVDLEGHGREQLLPGLDLGRTVGWFTALYPVVLPAADEVGETLRRVKEALRKVPHHGLGFGLLKAAGKLGAELGAGPGAETGADLLFNYLGRLDGPAGGAFSPVAEPLGALRSPHGARRYRLEVNAAVREGRFGAAWTCCGGDLAPASATALAQGFVAALRELAELAAGPGRAAALVPVDFPLAGLDRRGLEHLLAASPDLADAYALTPVQEGMLFQSLLGEGGGLNHEQIVVELVGPLVAETFALAWQRVVEHHAILRTAFVWEGLERPVQRVAAEARLPFTLVEPEEATGEAGRERLEAWLAADRGRPFDPASAPLARLALVSGGGERHVFVFSFHHLLLDGWSASLVLRDVFAAYRGLRRQETPALPAARPFRDYLGWLAARDAAADEAFWRQELAGFEAPTPLGIDHAAEAGGGGRGLVQHTLGAAATAALESFARAHKLTLGTLLHAAWGALLARLSGQARVLFGTTVAGRPPELAGVEGMVGMFINTLPLHLEVPGQASAGQWLPRVQDRLLSLRAHEASPLARLHALAGLAPGQPLFESLLVFENYPVDASLRALSGELEVVSARFIERTADALVLVVVPGERLALKLGHELERIDATAARRTLGHLVAWLEAAIAAPAAALGSLPLHTAAERQQLVLEWNQPAVVYDAGGALHQLVERSVDRTPGAVAVIAGEARLDYAGLEAAANRLARRLLVLGVERETPVGLCLERSAALIVGVLGILKAGGVYVPLDPEHPPERLAAMLDEVAAPVVVTEAAQLPRLPAAGPRLLCLDRDAAEIAREDATRPDLAWDPAELAYVMYTSGSTGRPKGVMVPHRGVVNRLTFAPAAGHLLPGDRFLHKASIGFDVSLLEIFLPLSVGGAVVLAKPGGHRDPAYLAELMVREGVHQAIFPPSLLRMMVAEPALAACRTLHSVASSAEALPVDLQEHFIDELPATLYNRYGPTEASIAASSWRCDPRARRRVVPIGRPIARARLLLVDRRLELGLPGAAAELVIAGPGLARGYFANPARTAEAFVPDPWSPEPGGRLYHTGDLARFRPDGAIEFLGRADQQVKIRGHRVELGEIAAVLREDPRVREAVVVDREDPPGVKRLVAYVVAVEPEAGDLPQDLRARAAAKLPDFMVPAAVVLLDALPLNTSGKVDRRALPAPEYGADVDQVSEPPATPVEAQLAAIFAAVLGRAATGPGAVGRHDDFFQLGGDSILSIRVVARANEAGLGLSVPQVFEHRTPAALALVAGHATRVVAEQGPLSGEMPLTPIMRRFFDPPPADPHWVNQALLLEVPPGFDGAALGAALAMLVEHHDALRLRFAATADGWQARFAAPGDPVPWEVVDLAHLGSGERRAAVEARAAALQAGLDLAAGPLVSAALFTTGATAAGRLLLVIHHLAVDGVSWRILMADLETLYHQAVAGEALVLPAKSSSYRQWAECLVRHAAAAEVAAEAAWWLDDRRSGRADLPLDHPEGLAANREDSAETVETALAADETEELLRQVPELYHTGIEDALLAALLRTVTRWTGEARLLVDLESHGRDLHFPELEVSRTVGWFTAIYPVLLDCGGRSDADGVLKVVKETLRRVPAGGTGYGLLRWLSPDAALRERMARLPAAPLSFNYLGQLDREAASSALFWLSPDPSGPSRSPRAQRRYPLEVVASVVAGRLEVRWSYSRNLHDETTIRQLADTFMAALRETLAAAESPDVGGYTPSDFADVDLDQAALDQILAQVGGDDP